MKKCKTLIKLNNLMTMKEAERTFLRDFYINKVLCAQNVER